MCGGCGRTAVKELCAFWPCESCVVFVGLFVASGGLPAASRHLFENVEVRGDAVVGVAWSLPSGLASGTLRVLNVHFRL